MSAEMSGTEEQKCDPAMLQVGGEECKLSIPETRESLDLRDRDPNQLNDHVKVRFDEMFAEPDKEVFSFDKIWLLSFKVFTNTKMWCYRITSLILGLPLAFCWGILFACLSFCNIWVYMPYLRCHNIEMFCVRRLYEICIGAFVAPCFEAVGRCFSGVVVRIRREEA